MTFSNIGIFLFVLSTLASAQTNVLNYSPSKTVIAKAGGTVEATLSLKLDAGYHVNSNTPSNPYLIPLRLTWNPGPLETVEVVFPSPGTEKFGFSETPLSVFTGDFEIVTRFKVVTTAALGSGTLTGKLRYQACNDRTCLTPKTIEVTLPIEIAK
jgi:DsbC/DsbD-like thiol-disulfide interchange protein